MHSLDPKNPIDRRIEQAFLGIDVIIPGRILSYSEKAGTPLVSVENAYYRKFKDAEPLALPVVKDVPYVHYQFKSAAIFPPIDEIVGANCLLLVCQRSIDEWLETGRQAVQFETRYFSIADAVAIPGPSVNGKMLTRLGEKNSLVVQSQESFLELSKDGFKLQEGEVSLIGGGGKAALSSPELSLDGRDNLNISSKNIKISGAELLKETLNQLVEAIKTSTDSGGDALDAGTIAKLNALNFDEVL